VVTVKSLLIAKRANPLRAYHGIARSSAFTGFGAKAFTGPCDLRVISMPE
jgi:hypothetical protein